MKKILITAIGSGSGKTTAACALLAALKTKMRVSAFKCGPDYIDPMFHTALGITCGNLDPFFCDEGLLKDIFAAQALSTAADITVIEGVMGYYDGINMTERASTYTVAGVLDCPVILVINARGMAAGIPAVIKGMAEYKPDSNIRGVILNNTSEYVFTALRPKIEALGIAALGFLPRDERFNIESRHLGLVTPKEIADIDEKMRILGESALKNIDIERLLDIAADFEPPAGIKRPYPVPVRKIAVARDNAFCFYYRENIEFLKENGCEIVYFSPLADKALPNGIDGLILGGGYPELYLKALSENTAMKNSVKAALEHGLPCLAECGGYMYLQKSIVDRENNYPMVGFIDSAAENKGRLQRFGYIYLTAQTDEFLNKGEKIRAHEFHYFDSTNNGTAFTAEKENGKKWNCIHIKNNCICGYPHIFYPAAPAYINKFLDICTNFRKAKAITST